MSHPDLSEKHGLIGNLFTRPRSPDEWKRYALSHEQIAFYGEHGYVSNVPLLTGEQCDVLCEELDRIAGVEHPGAKYWYEFHSNESSDPGTVLFHSLGAWRITPGFHDILWNPAFLAPASQLLGGPVRFWHDQLFCKPRRHGGVVAWHQDYSYWTRSRPMSHLTCFIALDDTTAENGCLHYVPDTHTWPLLPRTDLAGNMTAILEILDDRQREQFQPIPIELPRGCASFHHPLPDPWLLREPIGSAEEGHRHQHGPGWLPLRLG